MIDERDLVERAIRALAPEESSFEDLMRRRDRKRRNRRVAAAAVGLAIGIGGLALGSAVLRSSRAPVPVDWPTPSQTERPILREGEVVGRSFDQRSLMVAVDTATGDERPIVLCRSDCSYMTDFAASADGGWVAYGVSCGSCNPVRPEAGFWVAGADGPPRRMGDPDLWSWSPTAEQLAYTEVDPSGSAVFLLDPSTDVRTRIGTTDTCITALAWGPDGRSIAYVAEPGTGGCGASASADPTGVFIIRSGGEPEQVSGQLGPTSIAWSPDGTKLALDRQVGDRSLIAVVGIDGSGERVLDAGSGVEGPTPLVWSPDGDRIAYTRGPTEPGGDDLEFWAIGADGSGRVRLGRLAGYNGGYGGEGGPVWSPDSDRVAFSVAFSKDGIAWVAAPADGSGSPEPIDRLKVERWQL